MKKLFLILLILISAGVVLVLINRSSQPAITPSDASDTTTTATQGPIKKVQVGDYVVSYTDTFSGDLVTLYPNFDKHDTAKDLLNKNSCKVLINGGFYRDTTDSIAPIGLFISEYNQLNAYQSNSLFNGILTINDYATPRITRDLPVDRSRFALQTGPILIENGASRNLAIRNDSPNRRSVAAITGENKIFFLSIYDPKSLFSGPNLEELPRVLNQFENETGIQIADAINLDGGTASALLSNEVDINELSTIGSFFCVR